MKIMDSIWNQSFFVYGIWIIVTISIAIVLLQIATKGLGWDPLKTYAWPLLGASLLMLAVAYGGNSAFAGLKSPPIKSIPILLLVGVVVVGSLQIAMVLSGLKAPNMAYGFLPGSVGPVAVIFCFWIAFKILGDRIPWVVEISNTGIVLFFALVLVTFFLLKEVDLRTTEKRVEQREQGRIEIAENPTTAHEMNYPV